MVNNNEENQPLIEQENKFNGDSKEELNSFEQDRNTQIKAYSRRRSGNRWLSFATFAAGAIVTIVGIAAFPVIAGLGAVAFAGVSGGFLYQAHEDSKNIKSYENDLEQIKEARNNLDESNQTEVANNQQELGSEVQQEVQVEAKSFVRQLESEKAAGEHTKTRSV